MRNLRNYLSRIQECKCGNLWCCLLDVYRFADDCWVVSSTEDGQLDSRDGKNFSHSSSVTLFNVLLALSITFFPVAVEPVKLILSMPGWEVSQGPRLSSPLRAWTTPGGKKFCASSASLRPQYGVNVLLMLELFY
jgi:hypothetical protein